MASRPLKVLVIGGGAAGFFGAIACAEAHPHAQVMLLEAGRQLLPKVRISGGGRCNVTHACFDPAVLTQYYPRGGKALRGAFTRFQPRDMIAWLDKHGVAVKTEADGRMFPITDDSETIVDCFIHAAKAAGVEIRTGVPVAEITRLDSGFEVQLKSGQTVSCDRLLLTTGSSPQGYQLAKALGHEVAPPVPSLFTFNVSDPRLHDLAGVSANSVRVRLRTANGEQFEQSGPLLITHWGLSGPAVLKLSAWGARALHDSRYQGTLQINWLPQYKPEALREQLLAVKSQLPRKAIAPNCPVPLPRRLWERLIASAGITETTRWAELSNKALNQLLQELTQGSYNIKGKGVFKEEFVTCGGVSLKEVDFKTMESRCCPGLYLAGEILDIDGVTGGFNFQSAWTTAWLAGQAIAQ
uniref:NAD(P)/FAD-dependent oxidoreductase n=1 Tax=Trichocoleus desertorum TaxID=1481672 RepID=UPI0025B4455F|nr:NAD(P)/FAD-dependent oxidoreductase [Trichocoleus desertorum]